MIDGPRLWDDGDPSDEFSTIFKPEDHQVPPSDSRLRVCELCLKEHKGELIDHDGWARQVGKDPDEYI